MLRCRGECIDAFWSLISGTDRSLSSILTSRKRLGSNPDPSKSRLIIFGLGVDLLPRDDVSGSRGDGCRFGKLLSNTALLRGDRKLSSRTCSRIGTISTAMAVGRRCLLGFGDLLVRLTPL